MNPLIRNIKLSKLAFSLLFVCLHFGLKSQDTLRYKEFLELVKAYHPSAVNASLIAQQGALLEKSARGNYDPNLVSKYKEKYFQDKFYYRVFDAKLVVPTILGIDFEAGHGNNDGKFLNAENYTPSGGTGYLGVTIPLGKGLFSDENRVQLRLAQQQKMQKEALGRLSLNELMLEASLSYWEWYQAYYIAKNQKSGIEFAKDRFNLVRKSFIAGDVAAVDTLKAYVQYQEREIAYLSAQQYEVNAHWKLLNYFWDQQDYLRIDLIPEESSKSNLLNQNINDDFWIEHPALIYYMTKYKSYDAERKLKVEKLKPKLNFEYKRLYNQVLPTFSGLGTDQYWGFSFAYPILLRKERADLKISNLKIEQALNEYKLKERELSNKLKSYELAFDLVNEQLEVQKENISSYSKLINAETIKYRIGESTLFELNNWEQKMIAGTNKQFALEAKKNILSAKIAWALAVWE